MPPSLLKRIYELLSPQGYVDQTWLDESTFTCQSPGEDAEDASLGREMRMVKHMSRTLDFNRGAFFDHDYKEELHRAPRCFGEDDGISPVSLEELIYRVPLELNKCKSLHLKYCEPIKRLVQRCFLTPEEVQKYGMFDTSRNYTRNLVATDSKTYTLLLLCWNPQKESPIHDHPCEGCWVKGIQGSVVETVYEIANDKKELVMMKENRVTAGGIAYMDDSLGLHKVGNDHPSTPAITMHLYAPPYQSCKAWFSTEDASVYSRSNVTYFSMYGRCLTSTGM